MWNWSPSLNDLADLAATAPRSGADALRRVFEWQHERAILVSRGSLAAVVGLLAAVVGLGFGGEFEASITQVWAFSIAIGILVFVGVSSILTTSGIQQRYLRVLQDFADLTPGGI
jgi:hypothetical protein